MPFSDKSNVPLFPCTGDASDDSLIRPVIVMRGNEIIFEPIDYPVTGSASIPYTYDHVIKGIIRGNSILRADWRGGAADSSQDGIPTPAAPIDVETTIPAATYKLPCPFGGYWEYTLAEDMGKVGIYGDIVEVDLWVGKGKKKLKTIEIIMDGVSTGKKVSYKNADSGDYKSFYIINNDIGIKHDYTQGYCTHFPVASWSPPEGNYWWIASSSTGIRLHKSYMPNYDTLTTDAERIAAANAWFAAQLAAGVPVRFRYTLATYIVTPIQLTHVDTSTAPDLPLSALGITTPDPDHPYSHILSSGTIYTHNSDSTKSSAITIPEMSGEDAVCDTLEYLGGGMWRHIQDIAQYKIPTNVTWNNSANWASEKRVLFSPIPTKKAGYYNIIACTHANALAQGDMVSQNSNKISGNGGNAFIYWYPNIATFGLVGTESYTAANAALQAWLSANDVNVAYQRATPIVTDLQLGQLLTYIEETYIDGAFGDITPQIELALKKYA